MDQQQKSQVDQIWNDISNTNLGSKTKSGVAQDLAEDEIENIAREELQDYLNQKIKEDQEALVSRIMKPFEKYYGSGC